VDKSTLTLVPGDLLLSNPLNFTHNGTPFFPTPVQAFFLTLPSPPQLALLSFRFSSATKNMPGTSFRPGFPIFFCWPVRSYAFTYSEACIKGHRSSACKHTDRPLFEIKKKGRPITQCEHCRELRKTKQVHVKCMCEAKDHPPDKELAPVRKKGEPVYTFNSLRKI
jgi:hypothetical protein